MAGEGEEKWRQSEEENGYWSAEGSHGVAQALRVIPLCSDLLYGIDGHGLVDVEKWVGSRR